MKHTVTKRFWCSRLFNLRVFLLRKCHSLSVLYA